MKNVSCRKYDIDLFRSCIKMLCYAIFVQKPFDDSILLCRQLLGTEEESSDHATSEEEELMMENFPTSNVVASTMASMVASGKRSVWSITREQINYYTTQFFCLQSDPKGVIPGTTKKLVKFTISFTNICLLTIF